MVTDTNELYDSGEAYLVKAIAAERALADTMHEFDRVALVEQIMIFTELANVCFNAIKVRKDLPPRSKPKKDQIPQPKPYVHDTHNSQHW